MEPASSSTLPSKQKWFPLESNPDLMNAYVQKLGFNTDLYQFVDVISTDDWALDMIPQPVVAVIMLYPLTEKQLEYEKNEKAAAAAAAATSNDDTATNASSNGVWFIKQRIGNACGTIGLLHSLLNTPEPLNQFRPDSWLQTFQVSCHEETPVRKAEILEADDTIATMHDAATSSAENATSRGDLNDDIITHFIALVCSNNSGDNILYELDGRKAGPIAHGPTTPATLLQDSTVVIKKFMERDPGEIRFTFLALAPKQESD
jgi:ubiquitin carboxyl-terminal hydrolase L3